MILYQILGTNIMRSEWQPVRKIVNEILRVRGSKKPDKILRWEVGREEYFLMTQHLLKE